MPSRNTELMSLHSSPNLLIFSKIYAWKMPKMHLLFGEWAHTVINLSSLSRDKSKSRIFFPRSTRSVRHCLETDYVVPALVFKCAFISKVVWAFLQPYWQIVAVLPPTILRKTSALVVLNKWVLSCCWGISLSVYFHCKWDLMASKQKYNRSIMGHTQWYWSQNLISVHFLLRLDFQQWISLTNAKH